MTSRPGQHVVLALLAALVSAVAVATPLYARAMQQALVADEVARAPAGLAGLQLAMTSDNATSDAVALLDSVPHDLRRAFGPPVREISATPVVSASASYPKMQGQVLWRTDVCRHLVIVAGTCPVGAGEVVVSADDHRLYGIGAGNNVVIAGDLGTNATLRVVGVYRPHPSAYWAGETITGRSASVTPPGLLPQHDAWITVAPSFGGGARLTPLSIAQVVVELPARNGALDADSLPRVAAGIESLQGRLADHQVSSVSALPDIAHDVQHQRSTAQVTVILLMGQLGVLLVVLFWLVMRGAVEQRRPETALALLHGYGRRRAWWRTTSELLVPTLVGLGGGVAVGVLLVRLLIGAELPRTVGIELRAPLVVALVAAAVVLTAATMLAATNREPIHDLLAARSTALAGRGASAGAGIAFTVSAVLAAAFLAGWLTGPAVLLAPAALAVAVGLGTAWTSSRLGAALSRGLLDRGHAIGALVAASFSRSRAAGRAIVILTVAVAILVFSADALGVGRRNWTYAAQQAAGAAVVLEVHTSEPATALATLEKTLRQLDPSGRRMTPVVDLPAPNPDTPETLAVVPEQFARVAFFPLQRAAAIPWRRLDPPAGQPVRLSGRRLSGMVSNGAGVTLEWELVAPGAAAEAISVLAAADGRFSTDVPCADGCLLKAVTIVTPSHQPVSGTVALRAAMDGAPVSFGSASEWRPGIPGATVVRADPAVLTVKVSSPYEGELALRSSWFPTVIPAISSRDPGSSPGPVEVNGLDGAARAARIVATAPRVPASPPGTRLVSLESLARDSSLDVTTGISVWMSRSDPSLVARLRTALRPSGIEVAPLRTVAEAHTDLVRSIPAWSLGLAGLVGLGSLLASVLVLVALATAGRRERSWDLAALRMSGVHRTRSVAVGEQVTVAVLAVVAGAACGAIGAAMSLPRITLLAHPPAASVTSLAQDWPMIAMATAAAAAVLVAVAAAIGYEVDRRARLSRLQEAA